MSYKTMEQRFWEKVDKNGPVPEHVPELGGCWIWKANMYQNGYGQFCVNPKISIRSTCAHRVAWEISMNKIPEGICVLHRCDNRKCVRPSHLFLGTKSDNVYDAFRKGRLAKGEKQGLAKLKEAQICKIRYLHQLGHHPSDIAKQFHICKSNVHHIVKRKTWKHIK